jgi:hypothetical protein
MLIKMNLVKYNNSYKNTNLGLSYFHQNTTCMHHAKLLAYNHKVNNAIFKIKLTRSENFGKCNLSIDEN